MSWDEIKKARSRLAREEGAVIRDWGGRVPIALVYPNSYYVAMSCLGLHALYRLLNSYSGFVCERVFWEREHQARRSSPLSLESQRPLTDFAVLAFSISYEVDYINVVEILKASGIPLYAGDRDGRHPLVIAGGPCVTANPLPLSPFFDLLCIGEGEPIVPTLLPVLADGIGGERSELLRALSSLPGVYVPQCQPVKPVVRQWANDLDSLPVASTIVTGDTELGDLYLIEVERGCNWGCRFCMVSSTFSPVRFRSMDSVIAQAEEGLKYRRRLGLVGPAVADHPQIEEIAVRLRQMGAGLSVSSLRMKPLSRVLLRELAGGEAQTIAFAPEAGSMRLRQLIKKGISEDDILKAIDMVAGTGVKQLKLYFMIGLPSETDEDIEEIIRLVIRGKGILDRKQSGARVIVKAAPFVPKASTPLQWLPMAPLAVLNHRLSRLKNSLQPRGIKVNSESPAWSEVQAVFARGGADVAGVLAALEEVSLSGWRRAVARCRPDVDFYAHQTWHTGQRLPWAIIDSGIEKGRLELELNRALSG
ncbi:MAG: radical SAM protein [Dehalococcoidales bacterium]|nr:radical SAM protein [Dehalococcoidales bacterium]